MFRRSVQIEERPRHTGDRRVHPRHRIEWKSRFAVRDAARLYQFFDDGTQAQCEVRDLSVAGAGLNLAGHEVAVGDRIRLDLWLTAEHRGASIRLDGVVRHTRSDDEGVIAGVEFLEVGLIERALLVQLLEEHGRAA